MLAGDSGGDAVLAGPFKRRLADVGASVVA
jgi:hypothetical protein